MASLATGNTKSSKGLHGSKYHPFDMNADKNRVRVVELADLTVNPTPRRSESYSELFDEYIGEQKLKELTGKEDLSSIEFLEITIDVDFMSCGNFGALLPNLRELRLVKSNVHALRDLGASFETLQILWMPKCCLKCLDGLSSMGNLNELYLSFNEITDVSPVTMLERLEVLDLEGNQITEKSSLSYLKMCSNLASLTLEGNPIVSAFGDIKAYRRAVWKALPHVRFLDDIPMEKEITAKYPQYSMRKLEDEWNHINNLLEEVGLVSDASIFKKETVNKGPCEVNKGRLTLTKATSGTAVSGTGSDLHSNKIAKRMQTAAEKSTSSVKPNLLIKCKRPSSAATASRLETEDSKNDEKLSELTTGEIICGGTGRALRARRSSAATPVRSPDFLDVKNGANATTMTCASKFPSYELWDKSEKGQLVTTESRTRKLAKYKQEKTDKTMNKKLHPDQSADVVLQEEKQLRIECDAVLRELADWKETYAKSVMFRRRKTVPQVLKVHATEKDNDAILLSTDSESTLEDRSLDDTDGAQNKSAPVGAPSEMDEECASELSSSSGYDSRRTTTAGTDYNESPRDVDPTPKASIPGTSGRYKADEPSPINTGDYRTTKEFDEDGKEKSVSKMKEPANDLFDQSIDPKQVKSPKKPYGRPSFPPLAANSPTCPGSVKGRTTIDSTYRPRINLSGQSQPIRCDARSIGQKSSVVADTQKSEISKSLVKGYTRRVEMSRCPNRKFPGPNSSPLPSKPNLQPKFRQL